jgi:hypothetical protein
MVEDGKEWGHSFPSKGHLDMRAWGNWGLYPPKLMQDKRSILMESGGGGGAIRQGERAGNRHGIMVEAEESGEQQTSDEDCNIYHSSQSFHWTLSWISSVISLQPISPWSMLITSSSLSLGLPRNIFSSVFLWKSYKLLALLCMLRVAAHLAFLDVTVLQY